MYAVKLSFALVVGMAVGPRSAAAGDVPAPEFATVQPGQEQVLPESAPARAAEDSQATADGTAVHSGVFFRVGTGGDYRVVHGLPLYSGAFELSVGGQGQQLGAFGTLAFALARTPKGLSAWELVWSGSLLTRFNPFYAGGTLRWAYLSIARYISTDTMAALTVGLQAFAGYELFASEDAALFVELRGGIDTADQDKLGEGRERVFFPRAALRVGARF